MQTRSILRPFRPRTLAAALAGLAVVTLSIAAQATPGQPQEQTASGPRSGDIARGEYLVNSVAMCVQCHSPRDESGTIIADRKLTGAPMPVGGPAWSGPWAYQAPAIARLSGFTDDQVVMLLTEGHAGDRPKPRPPMPPFRMTREDATAIVAYLRSR
jgi:mono/diheme cytochrome c family protein